MQRRRCWKAWRQGLAAAKPGNACEDIANAFFAVLKRYGIVKDNRTGYPIGLSYPPDWGERTMSLRPGDKTELQPGMTFHFMTGLWLETMGLEITESIVITDKRRRMPLQRAAQAVREGMSSMRLIERPSPIAPRVDFDADGVQHGFLRLPYSRDDSAWGSVMIPITVVETRRGADGAAHRRQSWRRVRRADRPVRPRPHARQPNRFSGRVIIVPAMNYPAFRAGTRTSPIDRGNLNRSFPGRPDGTVTEKIADYFQRTLLPLADIVLDFHSGGTTLDFLPYAAAHELPDKAQEARCFEAVAAFAAPYSMRMLEIDAVGMYDTRGRGDGQDLRHDRTRRRRHRDREDGADRQARHHERAQACRHRRRQAETRADPLARHAVGRMLPLRRR